MAEAISDWLDRLGLRRYAPAFEANEITFEVASTLTEGDLRELGVKSLGHRRRLAAAIAALREREANDKSAHLERRYLTVMFCDLVGSTLLSTAVDPEELAGIIARYERFCSDVVNQHGGFVAHYAGDGMLAYFGYPTAFEDCAERAVRAALVIVRDIKFVEAAPGQELSVRVGIASGPVVVGDIGDHSSNHVVGQTPNLAARLQNHASENGIVIADSTYRLAGYRFRCSALDDLSVRGFPQPVKAWRIYSEHRYRGRFEARRAAGLTPFVGRELEFESLAEQWRATNEKTGRVVLITGEAGIGKSRLVGQFTAAISQQRHLLMTYYGSPHSQNSPLQPIVLQLEREALISSADSAWTKRVKLEALLSRTPDLAYEAAPILFSLLALQRDSRGSTAPSDSRQLKRQTLAILLRWLEARAAIEPLVLLCEDVHWFDPTSCELLEAIINRLEGCRILLILTLRPGFGSTWDQHPAATTVRLKRLPPALGAQIVEHVAANSPLSPKMAQLILTKCEGIPLFIEELTKSVLESNAALPVEASDLHVHIPDSLQDSLVARLDRLTGVREIAQVGAALGQVFRADVVAAVIETSSGEVNAVLRRLAEADLIEHRDSAEGSVAIFKHALVQDAVYSTLLHAKRTSIHRRVAEVLQARFPDKWETQPEILALHWKKAGALATAAHFFILAGKRAASRSATTEASMQLQNALRICKSLPEGEERDRLELEAALCHGGVLRATQGPHSAETGEAFARARDLCLRTGDDQSLVPALSGLFGYYLVGAKNSQAAETARAMLTVAESKQDRFYRMVGHRAVGMVHLHTGDPRRARLHLERSLELYDEGADGPAAFSYGTDHAQTASSFLALSLWVLGYADQASAREAWAIDYGTRLNHRYSLVQTTMFQITRNALARDWRQVRILAEDTRTVAQEHGFPLAEAMSQFYLAVCRAAFGENSPELLSDLDQAIKARGPINYHPFCLSLMAEAHAATGDVSRGLCLLSEAEAVVQSTREDWMIAELLRLRGEMLLVKGDATEVAEKALILAAETAERQGARIWQVRAMVSLARLMFASGRGDEARDKLEPLYAGFSEGIDSPDLTTARDMLAALSRKQCLNGSCMKAGNYRFW